MKKKIKGLLRTLFHPSKNSVFLCYLLVKLDRKIYKYFRFLVWLRLIRKYGIHVGSKVQIGEGLKFPHPVGIVIGNGVIIGRHCTIYQHVTLGKKYGNLNQEYDYPLIGNNVTIFPGAILVGKISVGDNSIIGANSVVLSDIEPNSIYAGNPARKIGER